MKGKYIVFEGGDGSGKTTLMKAAVDEIRRAVRANPSSTSFAAPTFDDDVQVLGFPSRRSAVGALIRDVFEGKSVVSPEAMLWLFVAEGKDMEPQIRSWKADGVWVLSDRHNMISGPIYQGPVHSRQSVDQVMEPAHYTQPDRIYIVDVPPEVGLARRAKRGEAQNVLYESDQIERLEMIRSQYRQMVDRYETAKIIDGTKSIAELVQLIRVDLGLDAQP